MYTPLPSLSPYPQLSLSLQVYWSDSGELACLASDDSYYILRHHADAVQEATSTNQGIDEDGIEAAFEVSGVELTERGEMGRGGGIDTRGSRLFYSE